MKLEQGNIGAINTDQVASLYEITGIKAGLIWCISLDYPKRIRVILPDQFWPLLDRMP